MKIHGQLLGIKSINSKLGRPAHLLLPAPSLALPIEILLKASKGRIGTIVCRGIYFPILIICTIVILVRVLTVYRLAVGALEVVQELI